jgi:superfamily I DNA/RNA helicase
LGGSTITQVGVALRQGVGARPRERLERGLTYVAITRAEEVLAFTRSTLNGFVSRIQQLLD